MRFYVIILGGFLTLITCVANAEMYKLYIKRDDSNLYIDTTANIVIKTKYCYEYTYGDEAILSYEKSGTVLNFV